FHDFLNNREKSLTYYEKSLSIARDLKVVDKMITVYALGVDIYTKQDNYVKALEASQRQFALYDSALNIAKNNKVAEMREKYETDKKEADNQNLIKDKQLAALSIKEKENQNTFLIMVTALFLVVALAVIVIFYYTRKRKKELETRNALITGINKKLNQSQNALLEANKTRDKFFALIAHDLRGPIASFQGIGRLIDYSLGKGKLENLKELIFSVDESASRLNSLLDNLLKWALSQTGALSFSPTSFNMTDLVDDTVEIYSQSYEAKNIELINEISGKNIVFADQNSVSTVLRNLLGNALKFSESGSQVTIASEIQEGQIIVNITDQGVGIPPDKLQDIFSMDDQKSTAGTQGEKGTGLGLMLCKEFILNNNGKIEIVSVPGQGTTITFSLPLPKHVDSEVLVASH
ncbi:MAG: HAMP domain-containing sensor histidine kinase, partial [Cyclobacteriaceae bacterium]